MKEYKVCTILYLDVDSDTTKEEAADILREKLESVGIDWLDCMIDQGEIEDS